MWHESLVWKPGSGWERGAGAPPLGDPGSVLFFGDRDTLEQGGPYEELRRQFPRANIAGCSTSGQIVDGEVIDDGVVGIAVEFADTQTRLAIIDLPSPDVSADCGASLGRSLAAPDLRAVFVLSDGIGVNATALIAGLAGAVGPKVPVTGGLAGDGVRFARTLVAGNCAPAANKVAAIGFYGARFRIGHGSQGGWKEFGPPRRITRAANNVLYELDGQPALDLYKRYLGSEAEGLPGSALLFPLKIRDPNRPQQDLVRTIIGVNGAEGSMVFAGDMPEGHEAQLMRGSHYNLIEGAARAATAAARGTEGQDHLAILVSCVGRKLLMGQRSAEEADAVRERFGGTTPQIGFYSYGEISPHAATGVCDLHNQTMTITTIAEAI